MPSRSAPTPRPGRPVRGSRTGRPVMALLDLLGRRWTLRVLWELRGEALSFRALRERCAQVSPSVLSRRLGELRDAGLVELRETEGYALTEEGRGLGRLLEPLDRWAKGWAARQRRAARGGRGGRGASG